MRSPESGAKADSKPLPSWASAGMTVRTPSGLPAIVIGASLACGKWEVIVEWEDGERGTFRLCHLREGLK